MGRHAERVRVSSEWRHASRRDGDLGPRLRGEAPVIDGVVVALNFFERAVTADRLDLVRGAVVLGHDAARGLAQAMADAMLAEAPCRDLLAEPIAEAVTAKRAAPFVWQERQRRVRARARFQGRAAWRGPPANVNRQGATCDIPDGRSCALKNGATEGANGESPGIRFAINALLAEHEAKPRKKR
jgi:hypothetical protein